MAIVREKTTVQARLSSESPSHARTDIRSRDLASIIDEPVERGGTNKGLTPTETAFAALMGCTNVIAHKCADKLGIDIGHMKISLVCDFDRRGVTLQEEIEVPFTRIQLKIETDGPATKTELEAVAKELAKYCPVAKMFRAAGTVIDEEWIPASGK